MHAARLGYQGLELLETGAVTLPMPEPERSRVMAIRTGERSFEEAIAEIDEVERRLADALERTALPAARPGASTLPRRRLPARLGLVAVRRSSALTPPGCGAAPRVVRPTTAGVADPSQLAPRLRSSVGRAPGFDPGRRGSTPLGGFDCIAVTTPWPSGEARACNARHGGSTPPGVSVDATMREEESDEHDQDVRPGRRSAASSSSSAAWRPATPSFGVLCADHHPGYSQPIGGGIAYEGYVSPSGVGYDIGCGNKAARTELTRADLDALGGVERGHGRDHAADLVRHGRAGAAERADHPVLDAIRNADFAPQRKLAQLAESQLGTVGSGNHYVNVMEDEEGRDLGRRALRLARLRPQDGLGLPRARAGPARSTARRSEGEMDSPPVLFEVGSELGESYVAAMELAGEYAYAGRDVVVAKVLEILGAEAVHEVHNHHNFAWREEHFGRTYWVIRKGCTPARPGQEGFVGGSMGDESVILEGVESHETRASRCTRPCTAPAA